MHIFDEMPIQHVEKASIGSRHCDCELNDVIRESTPLRDAASPFSSTMHRVSGCPVHHLHTSRGLALQDYFTTQNPFMEELELRIGEDSAGLVRAFYERPLFRGSDTRLPHSEQLEHERIFREEVTALLRDTRGGETNDADATRGTEAANGNHPNIRESTTEKGVAAGRGLERLMGLFDKSTDDAHLPKEFASLISRLRPEEREMVAWVDHCACLPRHLTSRDEVSAAVLETERILRVAMQARGAWNGAPGVVTIARSEGDGYVPADMVGFVEGQVLAMLRRLFDNGGERGLEVVYDDGLEVKDSSQAAPGPSCPLSTTNP